MLCLPGSTLALTAAAAGLRVVAEGYADRAYHADGTLVPRSQPGAVVREVESVVARTVRMAVAAEVQAADGSVISCAVESICLHGDTPGAVSIARQIRAALLAARVPLAPFAAAGSVGGPG